MDDIHETPHDTSRLDSLIKAMYTRVYGEGAKPGSQGQSPTQVQPSAIHDREEGVKGTNKANISNAPGAELVSERREERPSPINVDANMETAAEVKKEHPWGGT